MTAILEVDGLETRFGRQTVHRGLSFTAHRGEILGVVGGSGQGKSVLLRCILGFVQPAGGSITLFGEEVVGGDEEELTALRRRVGVLFQDGALFSSMSVLDNAAAPLIERTPLTAAAARRVAAGKLRLTGLDRSALRKRPSEISGGMRKRAGLARALALDPELLLLDEPTAGLDPIAASGFDALIRELCDALGLTVVLVTHDLDTLFGLCDRAAALVDGQAIMGAPEELARHPHPWLQTYFSGPRGRSAALSQAAENAA